MKPVTTQVTWTDSPQPRRIPSSIFAWALQPSGKIYLPTTAWLHISACPPCLTFKRGGFNSAVLNSRTVVRTDITHKPFSIPQRIFLIMAVTIQPRRYEQSDFQTGLFDVCSDCGTCEYSFLHGKYRSRHDLKHFVFIHVSVVPVIQAAMASGAPHASVAPLRVTWTSAAYGARACRYAASTGPDTTSK